jgi:hypothetical protein
LKNIFYGCQFLFFENAIVATFFLLKEKFPSQSGYHPYEYLVKFGYKQDFENNFKK